MEDESARQRFPPWPPWPTKPPEENSTYKPFGRPADEMVIQVTYDILIPIVATVGIVGNVAIFAVLKLERFRKSLMYFYMRGLAVSDLLYLVFSLQACYLVSNQYFMVSEQRNPSNHAFGIYLWNFFFPIWNLWAGVSDLIIVSMTVDRYKIMRIIDHLQRNHFLHRGSSESRWDMVKYVYSQFAGAFLVSLLFNLPYFFQFKLVPCQNNQTDACWTRDETKFAESVYFDVFGYLYLFCLKIVPSAVITVLNVLMLVKLKEVWRQRRKLRSNMTSNKRQEEPLPSVSTISQLLFRPPVVTGPSTATATTSGTTTGPATVESTSDGFDDTVFRKLRSRFGKPKEKKRHRIKTFFLPNKISRKEIRMTALLLSIVFCHVLLTLPGNAALFLFTVFPDEWTEYEARLAFQSMADFLYTVNYSINFFLYCAANQEIRTAVVDAAKAARSWLANKCRCCCHKCRCCCCRYSGCYETT